MQLAHGIREMYDLNHQDVRKIFTLEWSKARRRFRFWKHVELEDLIQGFYVQLLHRKTLESGFDYSVPNPSAQFATYIYTCISTYIKDYIQRDRRHSLGIKADTLTRSGGEVILVSESLLGVYTAGSGAQTDMNVIPAYGQDFVWSGSPAEDSFSIRDFCCEVEKVPDLRKQDRKMVVRLIHGLEEGLGMKELSASLGVSKLSIATWKKQAKEIYHRYTGIACRKK